MGLRMPLLLYDMGTSAPHRSSSIRFILISCAGYLWPCHLAGKACRPICQPASIKGCFGGSWVPRGVPGILIQACRALKVGSLKCPPPWLRLALGFASPPPRFSSRFRAISAVFRPCPAGRFALWRGCRTLAAHAHLSVRWCQGWSDYLCFGLGLHGFWPTGSHGFAPELPEGLEICDSPVLAPQASKDTP